ncbi:hypothetical protein AK973_5452 [Pseudomonas brassicacearum]|nr:hypothetical protein AK973_5452 [Pseudomonas brassicacearum]
MGKTEGHARVQKYKSGADLNMRKGRRACPGVSSGQKARSLPVVRLEGFAAVAAFAFGGSFLAAAEQGLGDDGLGLVGAMLGWLFAHGGYSRRVGFAG